MFKEKIINNVILVIGDYMLDSYWHGNVSRISPEAPVAVFQKESSRFVVGGAANVVANLLSAGKKVIAVSVIGNDAAGNTLSDMLEGMGCECSLLQKSSGRKTTVKTRLLAQNNQQLLRVDEEKIEWLNEAEENVLFRGISEKIDEIAAIILSDYMKGILTKSLCKKVIKTAKEHSIPVFCDVKDPRAEKYKDATLLKPNRKELGILTGMPINEKKEVEEACRVLCNKCENKYILVTLGSHGMALYTKALDKIEFIECECKEVYDVSGAGDTVISYLVACLTSGMDMEMAVNYANKAAGVKVGKVGTATVSLDEVEQEIKRETFLNPTGMMDTKNKIKTLTELMAILRNQTNKRVVFTNGCFDILHAGHVMYLQQAAECGDILIVGINSDESIRRLKGADRPVNMINDRLAVLSELESISYLVVFEEDTPENLIKKIKPNVLVKGADYEGRFIAGAEFIKENGGEVVLIPLLKNHSTTHIIKKLEGVGNV